jgi:hypothetical protein
MQQAKVRHNKGVYIVEKRDINITKYILEENCYYIY